MTFGGVQLTEAERLWPDVRSQSVEGIAGMLPQDLRNAFESFTGCIQQAGDAYPAIHREVRLIWTQQAHLPSKAKRRRTHMQLRDQLQRQAHALEQAAVALNHLLTLMEAAVTGDDAARHPDLSTGLEALLRRLRGVLDQAGLSHRAAVRDNPIGR